MPDPQLLRTVALASLPDTFGPVAGTVPGSGYLTQPDGWTHVVLTFEQTANANGSGALRASAATTADVVVFYWYTVVAASPVGSRTPITGQTIAPTHPIRNGVEALVPPGARYSVQLTALTDPHASALGLNVFAQSVRK
jgi:hypothetical protein